MMMILNDDDDSREIDRTCHIIQDRFTTWLGAYPAPAKTAAEIKKAFQRFLGPLIKKAKHVYTDNAPEFIKALDDLELLHDTSTPHRPQTNGVAERAVRRVKEGTHVTLEQSGAVAAFWQAAMLCYVFLRNVTDRLTDGHTAYYRRFGCEFKGPRIPFGAEVSYLPVAPQHPKEAKEYSQRRRGIFVGYEMQAGGDWGSDDIKVVDLTKLASAETTNDVTIHRIKAGQVSPVTPDGQPQ